MNRGLATGHAPSFQLIQAHVVLGLAGACLFGAGLVAVAPEMRGHFFQPHFLGLVHLCVLGWLMPIAIGAMHQLIPVVFEVPVRSERIAWIALVLYALGAAGLVGHMWTLATGWGFTSAAILTTLGIWLYAANLLLTLARSQTSTLTGAYVIASLMWLLVAVTIGLSLSIHLHFPWLQFNHLQLLRAHAHAAGLGFFGLLVMGVAYRLIEMFLLSYGAKEGAGWLALAATNAGLLLLTLGLGSALRPLVVGGAAAIAIGVAAFLVQVRRIYVRRTKRKGDAAWGLTFASFCHLAIVALRGAGLAVIDADPPTLDRLTLAYGLLALPGFVGSVVVGQLYKILPFLVWLHRFAPYVGLKRVPSASEILPEKPRLAQGVLMQAGRVLLAAGIVVDLSPLRVAGALVFAASALFAARNFAAILRSQP